MDTETQTSRLNQSLLFRIHGRRFLGIAAGAAILTAILGWFWSSVLWLYVPMAAILAIGLWDLYFSTNTILRNFPFLGHFRYISLRVSAEIRQYFVESNTEGKPFNKLQRDVVNKRADKQLETHPFGTEQDVYRDNYEWVLHSVYPSDMPLEKPRVRVGGPECRQPYHAAVLNISAMSYGSLSAAAVRALNHGAKGGGFYHNTGERGLSSHHEIAGADLVWEIGSGYFGCRSDNGGFDEVKFRDNATKPCVKMVELKLSQGAKPGCGGVLPARKNTPEIAEIRGLKPYTKVISPPRHKAFTDSSTLLTFIRKLRELSDYKPVGIKLCIGIPEEFIDICRTMIDTEITPDFITVDGSEGGTGAAPPEFSDSAGMPLEEALVFVTDTLGEFGLSDRIKIIAAGKIITGFDMVRALALGADICNSASGMMFALGCIQALKCDTDECPTGITTHNVNLTRGLVVESKAKRVANFQEETVQAAIEILSCMGLQRFEDLKRHHIRKRTQSGLVKTLEEIYPTAVRRNRVD